uniref:MFS domain-containing protein n=1 Tax=Caenorhabditis tropicalis TaxID=1561998 RepID=A0A1I7UNB0_9PELO
MNKLNLIFAKRIDETHYRREYLDSKRTLARKTLSTVKPSLINVWTDNSSSPNGPLFESKQSATEFLGALDTGFMITYSIGLYICGTLGDHYNPRRILALGMALSAISVFTFGFVTETLHVYSAPLYAILWISNGFFQSVGWPLVVCIMGSWFGKTARGTVIGAWSTNASVGNILATLIASWTVNIGYQWPFLIICSALFGYSILIFFHLPSAPWEVEMEEENGKEKISREDNERPPPLGFFRAWLLPGVIAFAISYLCLKLVNDGFFFWLPFYLHNGLNWQESTADGLAAWYDVGGIISSIIAGALSDRMKSRTIIIFVMLLLSTVSLLAYAHSPVSYYWNAFILLIVGFFIGGPLNMIAGCITSDLGKSEVLRGNAEALSTVTGIIDGTGSVGSAIGQWLIPLVRNWLGWDAIFYGFMIMVVLSAFCISPVLWREWKENKHEKVSQKTGDKEQPNGHELNNC